MKFVDFLKKQPPSYWRLMAVYPIISTAVMFFVYHFDMIKTAIYFVTTTIACFIGIYIYFRNARKRGLYDNPRS